MYIQKINIHNYRRLHHVTLELDKETTVLVGANNSGKTAALGAMAWFLRPTSSPNRPRLAVADIHASGWAELNSLGRAWLELPANLARDGDEDAQIWADELERMQAVLPSLDLELKVKDDELHLVSHLIPTLEWTSDEPLRVRLRVELAKDTDELKVLVHRYLDNHRAMHGVAKIDLATWPRSFVDFLSRDLANHPASVATWVLDAGPNSAGEAVPTSVRVRRRLESWPLAQLLRVDLIPAQRGLGSEELAAGDGIGDARMRGGVFTRRLIDHCGDVLKPVAGAKEITDLHKLISQTERSFDDKLGKALTDSLVDVSSLVPPNFQTDIKLRSRIRSEQLLDHDASVQYQTGGVDGVELPEHSIGLGYQNLLMLSFTLAHFRKRRLLPSSNPVDRPARIHLVLAEEPEAHLHVQVQRAFIGKARGLIVKEDDEKDGLTAQLVVSTHASHIAHALPFSHLRYFRRTDASNSSMTGFPTTDVINLTDTFKDANETRRFVERYLEVQHSDLFFADAAILVEGAAERMLMPLFIRSHEPPNGGVMLSDRYFTLLPINGAHMHRLKPLLEKIGLTTLLITDLDPKNAKKAEENTSEPQADDGSKKKPKTPKAYVQPNTGQKTTNYTLANWVPGIIEIDRLLNEKDVVRESDLGTWPQAKVRVAYQVPEKSGKQCGSTFEDALILENLKWFQNYVQAAQPDEKATNQITNVAKLINTNQEAAETEISIALMKMISSDSFHKAEFALDLIMTEPGPGEPQGLACPRYIREGLDWLSVALAFPSYPTAPAPAVAAVPSAAENEGEAA